MVTPPLNSWTVRALTALLWAAAAASVAYWALKLVATPAPSVPMSALPQAPAPDPAAVARLLGHSASAAPSAAQGPSLASRFALTGVVAGRSGGGAAIIAVDDRPPKPFRVGATVDDGLVLQSVEGRRARLGPQRDGQATLTLELSAPPT